MIALLFATLAGLIHVYIFTIESVLWGLPSANKVFAITPEQAKTVRVWAFNQGYYNLFLALAAFIGIGSTVLNGNAAFSDTLIVYSCLSMMGAGIVLVCSKPGSLRAAIIQAGPPAIAIAAWLVEYLSH